MEITINQSIYYSNKELVPIKEIAESLLALEAVIRQSPDVIEALMPDTYIQSVEVYVDELKSGSLREDFVVKFIFGSQERLDEFIAKARKHLKMDHIVDNPQLFSTILLSIIFAGGSYYLGKSDATPEQKATIEANHNTIIQIGAGMVEMDADEFKSIINNAVKDKDKLASDIVKIIRPAKLDSQARITFESNDELSISSDSIRALPSKAIDTEPEEYIEDFEDVELEIRAIDLDRTKSGWAVIAPTISEKRVKLHIDPGIARENLIDLRIIRGNITVISRRDKKYNKVPKLIFLRELVD